MKKCVICGRECKQLAKGMCTKHYNQSRKYGHCIDSNPRTIKDPNEVIEYEDHAEIILYNKKCEEIARALIDLEDVDKVKEYKWSLNDKGYVRSDNKIERIYLHRFVMNCPDDMVVDHINHNPIDNRKENLRTCTHQQNMINRQKQHNNTSGTTGVWWHKKNNKWITQITVNSVTIHLGYFDTKEEAIEARKQAEIDLFGEYRNQEDEE